MSESLLHAFIRSKKKSFQGIRGSTMMTNKNML